SPEAGIDTPIVGGAPDAQIEPSVAFDGTRYLLAWSDRRTAGESDVFAARVGLDGSVLDPVGIPLATGPGQRGSASVAAGGGLFVVAWADVRGDATSVLATRVSPEAAVLDPAPVVVDNFVILGSTLLAQAFDGSEFRLAWVARSTFF